MAFGGLQQFLVFDVPDGFGGKALGRRGSRAIGRTARQAYIDRGRPELAEVDNELRDSWYELSVGPTQSAWRDVQRARVHIKELEFRHKKQSNTAR
jgi:hypothetical protein